MTTPTTPHEAFLQAICESPHDDGPRLMYADWLEERGDPRGEFIRVQVQLAGIRPGPDEAIKASNILKRHRKGAPVRLKAQTPATLLARESLLLSAHGREWVAIIPEAYPSHWSAHNPTPYLVLPGGDRFVNVEFRRGFVERVSCTMQNWLDHGPALVQAAPLLDVRITDREPWSVDARYPDGYSWFRETDVAARIAQGGADNDWIPDEWFNLLSGRPWGENSCARSYSTAELAHADLSRVCIAWAREQAGLPTLIR